jgi:hypothetical protein
MLIPTCSWFFFYDRDVWFAQVDQTTPSPKTNVNSKNKQDPNPSKFFCKKIQTFFNGFHHYSHYIDYFFINCVPQLQGKGRAWRIKIKNIRIELYHVNTNIFLIFFLWSRCLICTGGSDTTLPFPWSCGTQFIEK